MGGVDGKPVEARQRVCGGGLREEEEGEKRFHRRGPFTAVAMPPAWRNRPKGASSFRFQVAQGAFQAL